MIARHPGRRATSALLALGCTLLALPAAALASPGALGTGGGGLGGSGSGATGTGSGTTGTGTSGTGTTTPTAPQTTPVSATGDGVTLQTTASGLARGRLVFSGTASGAAGRTIEIERRDATPGATWTEASEATVTDSGTFRTVWRPRQSGRIAVRALVVGPGASARVASAGAAPTVTITVYPTSKATIYGPGFYGKRTACGTRLTPTTIGVANRRLPCGTKVSILYDGRTLTVPVIDRGPYANGADWDLTTATAQALGMEGTSRIGTVALASSTVTADGRFGRRHR